MYKQPQKPLQKVCVPFSCILIALWQCHTLNESEEA